MRKFILCLLLGALLGMIPPLLLAQQSQNTQKSNPEVEALEKRISELEEQLQTVENLEKIDLQAKLAEANAKLADANTKLINTEFGTFKNELRIDNEERLRGWSHWFFSILVAIVAISGAAIVFWLKSLIADRVEKNLNGFKDAVQQVEVMKNELKVLKKAHAASVLEGFNYFSPSERDHPEQIKVLSEEDLLQVFDDEKYDLQPRYKAAAVLTSRKSSRLVPRMLKLLNSVFDSDLDVNFPTESLLRGFVDLLGEIYTPEACQGLKKFLDRLLTEDSKHKDLFLRWTVLSFTRISIELNIRDSVSIVREAMSHFETPGHKDLSELIEYFNRFNEPAAIKEILTQHVTDGMPEVENRCLELLQKYEPEFVENWHPRTTTDNSNA